LPYIFSHYLSFKHATHTHTHTHTHTCSFAADSSDRFLQELEESTPVGGTTKWGNRYVPLNHVPEVDLDHPEDGYDVDSDASFTDSASEETSSAEDSPSQTPVAVAEAAAAPTAAAAATAMDVDPPAAPPSLPSTVNTGEGEDTADASAAVQATGPH
jgi:hypothetical protein